MIADVSALPIMKKHIYTRFLPFTLIPRFSSRGNKKFYNYFLQINVCLHMPLCVFHAFR